MEAADPKTDPAPPTAPPGLDELPDWFQAEIEDKRTRTQVDLDAWRCREARGRRGAIVAGALLALFFAWGFLGVTAPGAVLVLASGALGAFLVCRFELGAPLGAVAYGLPVLLGGMAGGIQAIGIGFYFLVVVITGAVLGQATESLRGLHRSA